MDLTYEEYAAKPGVRWSHLKLLRDGSPLHYRHAEENPGAGDTSNRVALRAIHCAVLEPKRFKRAYTAFEGVRRGKEYKARLIANHGKTLLRSSEMAHIQAVAAAVRSHPVAGAILGSEGWAEVSKFWTNPETGLVCKGRFDWVTRSGIWDLKTVGASASERDIRRMAARLMWIGQQAHYREYADIRGLELTSGLICVEDRAPYDVSVFLLRKQDLDEANQERLELLVRLKECMDNNHWPGRCEEPEELNMKPWEEPEITFGGE